MPTADELIVQTLEEAGIEYVIGIPGGGTGQIFNLLYGKEDRIKTILVRHEQIAAIMADAYGRATGRPAAIMGQGLFMASIPEKYVGSTPWPDVDALMDLHLNHLGDRDLPLSIPKQIRGSQLTIRL